MSASETSLPEERNQYYFSGQYHQQSESCRQFFTIAKERGHKYKKEEPEDFAKRACAVMKKVDEDFKAAVGLKDSSARSEGYLEEFHKYLYGIAYQMWMTERMREEDKNIETKMIEAYALLDASYLGIKPSMLEDPVLPSVILALDQLGEADSPEGFCRTISNAVEAIMIILENGGREGSSDDLLPMLTYALARSKTYNIHSILAFIGDFMDPEKRSGKEYCYYTNLVVAVEFIKLFKPGAAIVRARLGDTSVPDKLSSRIDRAQYNSFLKPLREATYEPNFVLNRVSKELLWGSAGAGISSPIALGVGIATFGLGFPISICILGAGLVVGAIAGAVAHNFDIIKHVETVNKTLEPHGIQLVNPLITNAINIDYVIDSTSSDFSHIEWVVYSTPSK